MSQTASEADPARLFRYWQYRILASALVGYALYYFVRSNFNLALPDMQKDLGITKKDLGDFITVNGLLYGLSKFVNGLFVDRLNARWFMVAGLVASAGLNLAFGFSSELTVLGILWAANGWVQGLGFPPSARLMSHWFAPKELATKMSIWNVSHSIGAGMIFVICGYLLAGGMGWRACFIVPAVIAILGAVLLAICLRDTPESLGFPPVVDATVIDDEKEALWPTLVKYVFSNKYIWLVSFANFFVYIVRAALVVWGPTYLREAKGLAPEEAGWAVGSVEFAGVFGMVASGWITDRVFGGRGCRTCLFCMIGCNAALLGFILVPAGTPVVIEMILFAIAGFFMYGPQCLVGIIGAKLGTKRAAATAGGFTGLFGYLSSIPSGSGVGWMVDRYGWDNTFIGFHIASGLGVLLFALCWKAPPDGYQR